MEQSGPEGSKIDILGSPVTWAQSLIGRGATSQEQSEGGQEVSSGEPPIEGCAGGVEPEKEKALEDLEEEEVTFYSPEPTPRPFPDSNRRSERVARQRRDLARFEETPVRGSLKRSNKKSKKSKMAGVSRTPTKVPPSDAGTRAPVQPETVPMETDGKQLSLNDIQALLLRLDGKLDSMDSRLGGRLDILKSDIDDKFIEVQEDVDDLRTRVIQNEEGLENKIQKVIDRQPAGPGGGVNLEKQIDEALTAKMRCSRAFMRPVHTPRTRSATTDRSAPVDASREAYQMQKEGAYWAARRSLRVWPVSGPDLCQAASDFLVDFLKQDLRSIPSREDMSVRVAGSNGKAKNKDEVVIRFPDVTSRDAVRSAAFHLAGKKAGIRLEIPDSLRPSLRALETAAYNLKKKNPSMKRNVKFDDEVLDLIMDVRLDENSPWRKIRPEQALAAKEISPVNGDGEEMRADEIQSFCSSGQPSSGGQPQAQTPARKAHRTGRTDSISILAKMTTSTTKR